MPNTKRNLRRRSVKRARPKREVDFGVNPRWGGAEKCTFMGFLSVLRLAVERSAGWVSEQREARSTRGVEIGPFMRGP